MLSNLLHMSKCCMFWSGVLGVLGVTMQKLVILF